MSKNERVPWWVWLCMVLLAFLAYRAVKRQETNGYIPFEQKSWWRWVFEDNR